MRLHPAPSMIEIYAMDAKSPEVVSLKDKVAAASAEFDTAIALHENWKICVGDPELHARLGKSYASGAFLVIRQALRRETLLALMRMWDTNKAALSLRMIANLLRDKRVMLAITSDYAMQWGTTEIDGLDRLGQEEREAVEQAFRSSELAFGRKQAEVLAGNAAEALAIIESYDMGGPRHGTLVFLKTLRDEHLAHRQLKPTEVDLTSHDASDDAVEEFYEAMSRLVRLLMGAIGVDYRPDDTSALHLRHAAFFWLGVRGERTPGHPNYVAKPARPS